LEIDGLSELAGDSGSATSVFQRKAQGSMKVFDPAISETQIGLAYWPGVQDFVARHSDIVAYIEVPFEQLRHSPSVGDIQAIVPIVLHCASLSIAGFVPPDEETVDAIGRVVAHTCSPWIGEHLAYISADPVSEELGGTGEPTSLSYTLCPQLSEETVQRVVDNLTRLGPQFPVPLIVENSPQYFEMPGSTMNMTDFIREVVKRTDVGLILDLSHFLITARNTGVDVFREFDRLPLERVIEAHISGISDQSGIAWDDHALPAPPVLFELLERLLARAQLRALTFEYNWSASFPPSIVADHIARARKLVGLV
jgi:uncharacterized protein (UPF0276 family)